MSADDLEQRIASLAKTPIGDLRTEWQRLHGVQPPPDLGRSLLSRGIAYKWQEQIYGGLPASVIRELDRLAAQLARSGELDLERQVRLKVGTRRVRQWHGRTCHVTVLEDGYLFEDRRYASLSQVARAITGTPWSGPRFFGLQQRRRAAEKAHG